jgi:hypothetical protein
MSNVFTLDSLREATIRKFEPTKVGLKDGSVVELKSLLRLGNKTREAVIASITDMQAVTGEGEDGEMSPEESDLLVESISKVFNLIASSPAKLLKELDDPDPLIKVSLMSDVLNRWIGGTQLGEADSSPS